MEISGNTKLLGFFGKPHRHSMSPQIYNEAFTRENMDLIYLAFEADEDNIGAAISSMKTLSMLGANISMPCKKAVIEYLDEVREDALLCNSVNTVINDKGSLVGYNTDIYGIYKSMELLNVSSGDSIVILGGGGAARSAILAALKYGHESIKILIREKSYSDRIRELAPLKNKYNISLEVGSISDREEVGNFLRQADVLINATPVGMSNSLDESPIPLDTLPKGIKVMDMIYAPDRTRLLEYASSKGCNVLNGLMMLKYQGEKNLQLFRDAYYSSHNYVFEAR